MKLAFQLRHIGGQSCLPTDLNPAYNPTGNPALVQSWGPEGREPDVDPNRPGGIGSYEVCQREGAIVTFAGNGQRVFVLIPSEA